MPPPIAALFHTRHESASASKVSCSVITSSETISKTICTACLPLGTPSCGLIYSHIPPANHISDLCEHLQCPCTVKITAYGKRVPNPFCPTGTGRSGTFFTAPKTFQIIMPPPVLLCSILDMILLLLPMFYALSSLLPTPFPKLYAPLVCLWVPHPAA